MTANKKTSPKTAHAKRFQWTCKDGAKISLPSLASLDPDMDLLEELKDDLKSDNPLISLPANRKFLLSALPGIDAEALRKVNRMIEFGELLDAWAKHSGVSVGELPASSNS